MECVANKKNIFLTKCKVLPQQPMCMIETPDDFFFTPEQLATASAFKTALQDALEANIATRVFLWPKFNKGEDKSTEAIYDSNTLGVVPVNDGRYEFLFHISESMCFHRNAFTHRANNGRAFICDVRNQITGTEDSDGNFMGFRLNLLNTEKMKFSDGQVATTSPIYVVLQDNLELDEHGVVLDRSIAYVFNQVKRLTDVDLVVSNVSADNFTVTVTTACDDTPVLGLLAADFIVLDNAGDAQAHTITDNGDGTYLFDTGTAFVDGTVDLRAANLLTVKAYESTGKQIVNVP